MFLSPHFPWMKPDEIEPLVLLDQLLALRCSSGRKALYEPQCRSETDGVTATYWDERYAVSDMLCSGHPNVWVKELAGELPAGRMLDQAGGEGRNALWLAQQGWEATIVDFSQCALDRAMHCAGELSVGKRVHVHRADVRKYQPQSRDYDLVLIAYLHLPPAERQAAIARSADAVATGGRLLVIGHDRRNLEEGIGGPQDDDLLFTPKEVAEQLADLGFLIDQAQTRARLVDTDHGPRIAFDAVVLATQI